MDNREMFNQKLRNGGRLSDYNPLLRASSANDGQEILNQFLFAQQMIYSQEQSSARNNGRGDALDAKSAMQLMSGYAYEVEAGKRIVPVDMFFNDLTKPDTAGKIDTAGFVGLKTSELQSGVDKEGKAISYKDITYANDAGNTHVSRFVFMKTPDASGVSHGIWLLYSDDIVKQ